MQKREEDVVALRDEAARMRAEINTQAIRLTLAQGWINFLREAYDALLHYGVNYKSLKEFQDTGPLDEAQDMPVSRARTHIVEYLGRCTNAIKAAIRRKQFTVH